MVRNDLEFPSMGKFLEDVAFNREGSWKEHVGGGWQV